ncbi:MAG: basic amino acid ABC transporter substrate-binding protein [Clostridia bacterium]|nr:basic amino acid ABC transporter substrate-binding protein [Clostridia bacterium]
MKKNLLKIAALAMVSALAVSSLAGCGAGDDASNTASKGTLTMATNAEFPPFEYLEGEEIVGADVDMAKAVAEYLGYELEITNIDFDAALTGAQTGKYDMAVAGITANEERRQNMNFSNDYFKASQSIIVNADSEIKAAADLEGKTVSCQEGTTGEQYLLDNGYQIQSFKTGSEAITALTTGKVDAVVIDNAVAKALSAEQNGKTVVLDEALTQESYAIAMKLGNDELTEEINKALAALKEDGTLAQIFEKYELTVDAE